jgi:hypothetical protein
MTTININNTSSITTSIPHIVSANFNFIGNKVHSALKIQDIYGTFVSNIIEAASSFIRWHKISWEEIKNSTNDIKMFIRTSDTREELNAAMWNGPYIDGNVDLDSVYGKYLQFCVIIKKRYDHAENVPSISNINVKYYTSESSARFYTKAFNVGFTPKTAILTYNADLNEDAIVRFAISGIDSPDTSYYQYLEPNKIIQLDSISYLSDNVKIMMEMIGTSQSRVVVNEFAIMFGGEDTFRVNKAYTESSSSLEYSSSSSSSSDN